MRNKIYLLLLAVLFVSQGLFAQHQKHTHPNGVSCGSDHLNNLYFQNNPEALQKRKAFDQKISTLKKTGMFNSVMSMNTQQIYEIPIVVHIAHLGEAEGTFYNPSDQQIINWVNYTNDVLSGTANGILGENNGGTNIPVRLVLAKRTESCEPTNGIVRVNASGVPGYAEHGVDFDNPLGTGSEATGASHQDIRNLSRWDPFSYYNLYIVNNITAGVAGFAYHPEVSSDVDGSFMETAVVGSSTTFAHEMGHAFGLYHTFEAGNGDYLSETCPPEEDDCALQGDKVCDTERIQSLGSVSYFNYPDNNTINPCTGVNYQGTQYNIMHYGAILNRFTSGQRDRAILQILEYRSNLLQSLGGQELEEEVPNIMLTEMCVPQSSQTTGFKLGPVKVSFGDILMFSVANNDMSTPSYMNYINFCFGYGSTTIPGYEPAALSVSVAGYFPQQVRVFIDWNNNGIFEEATETVIGVSNGNNVPVNSTLTVNITPPPYAVKGTALRMRVIADASSANITPCYTPYGGQVEDYAVTVIESITSCDGISDEITAEISSEVAYSGDELYLTANGVLGSQGVEYQ